MGAVLGVVALGALGYFLYQKQTQSNANFRNQVEITPTQWTQSSQPGTQMYESPQSPVPGTQVYGNPIMSSTSETPVVHSTEGAKFDPHTGQPIPKFDPMTGKQNVVVVDHAWPLGRRDTSALHTHAGQPRLKTTTQKKASR